MVSKQRPGRPHIPSHTQRNARRIPRGALAQLGERLICIQEVNGSIPLGSTNPLVALAAGAKSGR